MQVRVQLLQKAELGLLALFARGAAGKVGADDGELARGRVKAQFQVAAFGVELGEPKPTITSLGSWRV
jgi:hypothetical protein